MTARAPRIHGTGEPWKTMGWALAGMACGPVAIWIAWAVCKAALAAMVAEKFWGDVPGVWVHLEEIAP